MLLDIEGRIGELLPSAEETIKTPVTRPTGISHHRAIYARAISKHPEIVEKVKAKARENKDIPTRVKARIRPRGKSCLLGLPGQLK